MADTHIIGYDMAIKFKLSLTVKTFEPLAKITNTPNQIIAKNAMTVTLKQKLPIVPTEEMLQKYADAIKNNYTNPHFDCHECHFDGYEYINPITQEDIKNESTH